MRPAVRRARSRRRSSANFPRSRRSQRLEIAGPGFLNVFLVAALVRGRRSREILAAGAAYGAVPTRAGRRVRLEFVSANPTGPLVIVNARAAAVGDALARLLRRQGARVTTEYYVNDAGNQFEALARSFEVRVRQALGEAAALPENGYPGEYLIDLAAEYARARDPQGDCARLAARPDAERIERLGRCAVDAHGGRASAACSRDYGVALRRVVLTSSATCATRACPSACSTS